MKNPGICLWCDLTLEDVTALESLSETEDIRRFLCVKYGYDCSKLDIRQKILIDLYYYTLVFAREHHYRQEQTSVLFSLVKRTHEKATETPYGNVTHVFNCFKENLLCHSVKRPPFSVDIFNVEEVREITEHVVNTYFRHFKLYKFAFTPHVTLDVAIQYEGVEEEEEEEAVVVSGETREEDQVEDIIIEQECEKQEESSEPAAVKELKALINTTLDEQITKLKLNVDSRLQDSLQSTAGTGGKSPPRSARKTAKGKK